MPLGRQFRNTYWHDADGVMHVAEESAGLPGEPAGSRPEMYTITPPEKTEHHLQGMLFDPYTATGHRNDPLIPHEARMQAIKESLGLTDVERYRARLGSMIKGQRVENLVRDENGDPVMTPGTGVYKRSITSKRGPKAAQEDMDLIARTLDESDMPTHVIKSADSQAVLDPRSGRAYAEDHTGRFRLTTDTRKIEHVTPEQTVTRPTITRGEPLRNANFHSQINKVDWDSYEGMHENLVEGGDTGGYRQPKEKADVHFWHPETGEEVHPSPDVSDVENGGHIAERNLHANIWPGSGKTTDKVIATPFKVYNGIGRSGNEQFRTFHTRHAAVQGEPETVTIPAQVSYTTQKTTSQSTITHELGHVRDPQTADPFSHRIGLHHKADPLEEGLADGHADRYTRHAGDYEEALHPDAPGRTEEILGRRSGYGVDYHHWKGDSVGRALYVAARTHAAMSDSGVMEVPSRRSLARQFGIQTPERSRTSYGDNTSDREVVKMADTAVLGHMYHEHEHVRAALHNAGMGKVGEQAHAVYLQHLKKSQPQPEEQWTQAALPMTVQKARTP